MTNIRVEIKVYDPDNEIVMDSIEGRMMYYRLETLEKEFENNKIDVKVFIENHFDMEMVREYYKIKRELQEIKNDKT
jgi:hypothetical protein